MPRPACRASGLDAVAKYIANQEQHHKMKSFRDELVEMLEKSGVDYNSDYLQPSRVRTAHHLRMPD